MTSISDIINQSALKLECVSDTAFLDAKILLAKVLDCDFSYLVINSNKELSDEKLLEFQSYLDRRLKFEPVSYITGEKYFYKRAFCVEAPVLIPRPETEGLISESLRLIDKKSSKKGLEIGIGTGIISITIVKERENCSMIGIDIDDKAIRLAKKNAQKLNALENLVFLKEDMFEYMPDFKLDFIVSNPPYINSEDYENLDKSILDYESKIALLANDNGLECYKRIIKIAKNSLNSGGFLSLEIGYDQAEEVVSMLDENGFKNTKVYKDFSQIDRVITTEKEQ